MRKLEIIIGLFAAMLLAGFLGCSSVMDICTPAYIDPCSASYADVNSTSFMPFTTLWDARRVFNHVDYKHQLNQIEVKRLAEDDDMSYEFLRGALELHIAHALTLQRSVFSPEGPLGLLIPAVFGTTIGALLIPRPTDRKKIAELQNGGNNGKQNA